MHTDALSDRPTTWDRPSFLLNDRSSILTLSRALFLSMASDRCEFHEESRSSAADHVQVFDALAGFAIRTFRGGSRWCAMILERPTSLACIEWTDPPSDWTLVIAADDQVGIDDWLDEFDRLVPALISDNDDTTVAVCFWNANASGTPRVGVRQIETLSWDQARNNYPSRVREQLDQLHAMQRPAMGGKLVVLYGPPGTGKTSLIRSLLKSWSGWATPSVVADPENLFNNTAYLNEVVNVPSAPHGQGQPRWNVVIIEDVDEFVLSDAKQRSGQGMARLLNIADGLIGQGLPLLLVLTTNVDRQDLHPALVRPGRCIANIALDAFPETEAEQWLDSHGVGDCHINGSMTLADLFDLADPHQVRAAPVLNNLPGYA